MNYVTGRNLLFSLDVRISLHGYSIIYYTVFNQRLSTMYSISKVLQARIHVLRMYIVNILD